MWKDENTIKKARVLPWFVSMKLNKKNYLFFNGFLKKYQAGTILKKRNVSG